MSVEDSSAGGDANDLQFDRVETTPRGDAPQSHGVTCAVCNRAIETEYYHANGKPICEQCRHVVMAATATPKSVGPLVLAALFGLGAAIAGAAIYYAVIAIANLEIGIVAILIGYMVGWAVRKGAGGRGGRRFQILAVALTYWAVGLAYAPLAFKEIVKPNRTKADSVASAAPVANDTAIVANPPADPSTVRASAASDSSTGAGVEATVSGRDFAIALGGVFLLIFALPVLTVFGSMPFGLISALIIFIGMRQAWVMTGVPKLAISGPYKVGAGPTAATA